MTEARGQQNIDDIFHQLNDKAKKVYRFVTVYHDILHFPRDYGTGQPINMVEVHTLTDIAERPGTTVTQLAQYWNRTPSAICQTVKKLEAKGYIERRKEGEDAKTVHLYATEEGKQLSMAHKLHSTISITETLQYLRQSCTSEEIETFYKVIDRYTQLLKKEWRAKKVDKADGLKKELTKDY